jgi:hypothetical protein
MISYLISTFLNKIPHAELHFYLFLFPMEILVLISEFKITHWATAITPSNDSCNHPLLTFILMNISLQKLAFLVKGK